ncbi:restriction endonuclease subunit S [Exiguobacterium artemiae]
MFESIIKNKEKLIDLLKEQRQSIITESVKKGLNSNVKMRDSDIDWIGEIPKHWETKRLKYCFKVMNGKEIEIELDINDKLGINVYGSGGLFKKTSQMLFEGESVLFGRKGTIGKPLYVNDSFWTVDTMYYTKFYKDSHPKWFFYLLLVYPWDMIITKTALPSVVGSDVANTVCAVPPLKEQVAIAKYLTLKDDEYFNLFNNINSQIKKLKEYRQALIYEAVTGKIDLCDIELD